MKNKPIFIFLGIVGVFTILGLTVFYFPGRTLVNYAAQNEKFSNEGVPYFSLPQFDLERGAQSQDRVSLTEIHAKVILVNFWATWCAPCVRELPSLVELAEKYKDRPSDFQVLAISEDARPSEIGQFIKTKNPRPGLKVLLDTNFTVASLYGTKKIPETYIMDSQKKLLRKVIDAQNWTEPEFLQLLESWIRGA